MRALIHDVDAAQGLRLAEVAEPVPHTSQALVGGTQLAEAFALLEEGGIAQSIGKASRQPTTIDFERERLRGGNRRLEPFVINTPLGTDLTYLIGLVAQELLDPQIGWRSPWDRAAEAADALLSRRIPGKAVLDITPIRTQE
jgi:NADPH:quinone reductase-like Zn-dependent oxidoreductase